jgi:hypothetical protein
MTPEDWKRLEELKEQTDCEKDFACFKYEIDRLCKGKYYIDLDIMECLDDLTMPCSFSISFSSTRMCTCPLRKFIAQNIEKWTTLKQSLGGNV